MDILHKAYSLDKKHDGDTYLVSVEPEDPMLFDEYEYRIRRLVRVEEPGCTVYSFEWYGVCFGILALVPFLYTLASIPVLIFCPDSWQQAFHFYRPNWQAALSANVLMVALLALGKLDDCINSWIVRRSPISFFGPVFFQHQQLEIVDGAVRQYQRATLYIQSPSGGAELVSTEGTRHRLSPHELDHQDMFAIRRRVAEFYRELAL